MLTIRPVQTKVEQQHICAQCGMEYIPPAFCHAAEDNGLLGAAQSRIVSDIGIILDIREVVGSDRDEEAMFLLCRAVLNFFDLCGIKRAEFRPLTDDALSLALAAGFKPCGDKMEVENISALFEHHCGGQK